MGHNLQVDDLIPSDILPDRIIIGLSSTQNVRVALHMCASELALRGWAFFYGNYLDNGDILAFRKKRYETLGKGEDHEIEDGEGLHNIKVYVQCRMAVPFKLDADGTMAYLVPVLREDLNDEELNYITIMVPDNDSRYRWLILPVSFLYRNHGPRIREMMDGACGYMVLVLPYDLCGYEGFIDAWHLLGGTEMDEPEDPWTSICDNHTGLLRGPIFPVTVRGTKAFLDGTMSKMDILCLWAEEQTSARLVQNGLKLDRIDGPALSAVSCRKGRVSLDIKVCPCPTGNWLDFRVFRKDVVDRPGSFTVLVCHNARKRGCVPRFLVMRPKELKGLIPKKVLGSAGWKNEGSAILKVSNNLKGLEKFENAWSRLKM